LWQACLGRVVIFTANFLGEDVFIIFHNVCKSSRNCTTDSMPCVLKKLPQSRLPLYGHLAFRHPGTDKRAPHKQLAHCSPSRLSWSLTTRLKSQDLENWAIRLTQLTPPPCWHQACAVPSELGTSRLESSSATSCVQNLVYKISKASR
jgi:hypothetical protein